MTSTYPHPTGHAANPLQPTASGPNVPQGLDIGAPGHTPVPQHKEHTMTGANTTESSTYGKPTTFSNQGENFAGTGTDYNSGSANANANMVPSTFDNKGDNFTGSRTGTDYGVGANTTAQSNFDQPTYNKAENLTGAPAVGTGVGYGNTATNTTSTNTTSGTTYGQDQSHSGMGGETVLDITAPDNKTIVISGYGSGYTMTTTFENRRELFTIRRGTPNTPAGADETADVATGSIDETSDETTTGEPFVAQVEPHQLRATKFSWKGGQQMKLKDWLGGRGTATHTIHEGGKVYEWRKSFANMSRRLELYITDQPDTRIAWVQKVAVTQEDEKEHEHMRPPLPPHPATAKMWVTSTALPVLDMVVVSFLLVDRESRNDPLTS